MVSNVEGPIEPGSIIPSRPLVSKSFQAEARAEVRAAQEIRAKEAQAVKDGESRASSVGQRRLMGTSLPLDMNLEESIRAAMERKV